MYHRNGGVTENYFDNPTSNDSTPSNALDLGGNSATFIDDHLVMHASATSQMVREAVSDICVAVDETVEPVA